MTTSDRNRHPISTGELERRQSAVRAAMADERIDVLVTYSVNEFVSGYVKYLIDLPAFGGYPEWLVFPLEDDLTHVTHGAFDGDSRSDGDGMDSPYGVGRILTTPAFASARQTAEYESGQVIRALDPHRRGTIGLVGGHQMPHAAVEHLHRELSDATFVDATDLVDTIKRDKSPEELELIRRTARMQDTAMKAAFAAIEPGMREFEIVRMAQTASEELGSEYGLYMCGSAPIGEPAFIRGPHEQGRTVQEGDAVTLMIENAGPGGLYTELGRVLVLGDAPQSMHEGFAQMLEAQRFCAGLISPGSDPAQVWAAYNEYMLEHDLPPETRIHCHGQGVDLVERPLVRFDDTLPITKSTSLACHPAMVRDGHFHWVCDNFLFDQDGKLERIHEYPPALVER